VFRRTQPSAQTSPVQPVLRSVNVLGARTAYFEAGSGRPIVLVNAGLGASTVWLRLMPQLAEHGRVLAVDLVGTGASDRLEPESGSTYTIEQLRTHFDAFLQLAGVGERATIVVLGLASMAVLDWAAKSPERVAAICHMESILEPWVTTTIPDLFRPILERARSEDAERFAVYSDDHLREAMRTQVMPPVDREAADRYRVAYGPRYTNRRLQLSLIEQIPVDGQPVLSEKIVSNYRGWIETSSIPKLLILGQPGHMLSGRLATSARLIPNQKIVEVVGTHLLPADSPSGVERHLLGWLGDTAGG
jgi:haloalkane dehalogenase